MDGRVQVTTPPMPESDLAFLFDYSLLDWGLPISLRMNSPKPFIGHMNSKSVELEETGLGYEASRVLLAPWR